MAQNGRSRNHPPRQELKQASWREGRARRLLNASPLGILSIARKNSCLSLRAGMAQNGRSRNPPLRQELKRATSKACRVRRLQHASRSDNIRTAQKNLCPWLRSGMAQNGRLRSPQLRQSLKIATSKVCRAHRLQLALLSGILAPAEKTFGLLLRGGTAQNGRPKNPQSRQVLQRATWMVCRVRRLQLA